MEGRPHRIWRRRSTAHGRACSSAHAVCSRTMALSSSSAFRSTANASAGGSSTAASQFPKAIATLRRNPVVPRPPHRRPARVRVPLLPRHAHELDQPRPLDPFPLPLPPPQTLPLPLPLPDSVPRTHLLTDVAPEHPVPDERPQLHRDRAPMLDRQVRDAAARVDDRRAIRVTPEQRTRRTRLDARVARAAAVGGERRVVAAISRGRISAARKKYEPRSGWMSIVLRPNQPSPARRATSRSSTGPVSTYARASGISRPVSASSQREQREQLLLHRAMVVAAAGVARDDAARWDRRCLRRNRRRKCRRRRGCWRARAMR